MFAAVPLANGSPFSEERSTADAVPCYSKVILNHALGLVHVLSNQSHGYHIRRGPSYLHTQLHCLRRPHPTSSSTDIGAMCPGPPAFIGYSTYTQINT
jgi:hypothetical protein